MGLILDTDILISSERRREDAVEMLRHVRDVHGDVESGISAVSAIELTHGVARAKDDATRLRREAYAEEVFRLLTVYPLTLEIARLAEKLRAKRRHTRMCFPSRICWLGRQRCSLASQFVR